MITQHSEIDDLFEKNPALAEAELEKQVKKNARDAEAWLLLGTTRLKLLKFDRAAEAFREALKADTNNRPAMVLLATALEQAHELNAALDAWKAITRADPTSKDAQTHVAKLADATGHTDVALDARRELVKLQPGNPATAADLAVYLARAKKHSEALRFFEKANLLEPGFLEKHPVEAVAYRESKAAAAQR